MGKKKLSMGDSLTGLLIDGVPNTPWVVGTLTYDSKHGVRVEAPFISDGVEQFSSVSEWAKYMRPPSNLVFMSDRQNITLYDCRVTSSRETIGGNSLSNVQITPREVVLKDREGDHEDELKIVEMRSHIDGLSEWTNFRSTKVSTERDEEGLSKKLTVEVESREPISWKIGEVTYSLQGDWSATRDTLGMEVREWVSLHTAFETPRPCSEHLAHQRKFVSLLALVCGTAVCFRKHEVRDSRFSVMKDIEGGRHTPFFELISSDTVGDYERPRDFKRLSRPLVTLRQVGREGLEKWFNSYEEWERVIQPVAGTLQRPRSYVEDHVVNACMGLEAAGHILGEITGEGQTYSRGELVRWIV